MNRAVAQVVRLGQRQLTTSASLQSVSGKGEIHPQYMKIKEKYKKFQIDDGVPIHLKGGAFDRILYMTTLFLCGVGLVGCGEYYYRASFPKKC